MLDSFMHSGAHGDIVYSLLAIKACGGGALYLRKERQFATLAPLLAVQSYVREALLYDGRPYDHHLDDYRPISRRNPSRLLTQCHLDVVGKSIELTTAWLENVEPQRGADIVVACTPRYHDAEEIEWPILSEFRERLRFIGYDKDWRYFSTKAGFKPARLKVDNALQFAAAIKGSRIFLGNQSLGFAIAEGLKHPRVLEVCRRLPNCMPQGDHGFTRLSYDLLRSYLDS